MRSQPSCEERGGGLGAVVVAGRDRRAPDLELADLAVAARARRSRGRRCGARARAPAGRAAARRRAPVDAGVDGRGVALGLEHARGRRSRCAARARALGTTPPIITSAMPKAGNTAPGSHAVARRPAATNVSTESGSTGSAPFSATRSGDRSRPVALAQGPGGEHVGEVRPGGGRAAVVRQPLHPPQRARRGSPAARRARAACRS